jgi:FkbM family methyltransferase
MSPRRLKRIVKRVLPDALVHAIAMARAREPLLPFMIEQAAGGTFIDVGANIGVYTHAIRKVARRVVAFEPVPSLAEALRRRYPDVEVHACALSASSGQAILHIPSRADEIVFPRASLNAEANPGFHQDTVAVTTRSLDDFRFQDVRAIKIDVEGHEEAVLRGAVETIRATRPALLVEIEERHHPGRSSEIMRWIEALGYAAFFHDGHRLVSAASHDFASWQQADGGSESVGAKPDEYVNNFLFLKDE